MAFDLVEDSTGIGMTQKSGYQVNCAVLSSYLKELRRLRGEGTPENTYVSTLVNLLDDEVVQELKGMQRSLKLGE